VLNLLNFSGVAMLGFSSFLHGVANVKCAVLYIKGQNFISKGDS